MDMISTTNRTPPRENQPTPQIINPKFRRNLTLIKQKEQKGPDQQVRTPFQVNYIDEEGELVEDMNDTQINLMEVNDNDSSFLTQEEQDLFLLSHDEVDPEES